MNREVKRLERRLATIDRGILAMYELGREAYRIRRKTERKLAKAKVATEDKP